MAGALGRPRREPFRDSRKTRRSLLPASRFLAPPLGAGVDPFMIHLFAALVEKERALTSQRTKAALSAAGARGQKLGNPKYRGGPRSRRSGSQGQCGPSCSEHPPDHRGNPEKRRDVPPRHCRRPQCARHFDAAAQAMGGGERQKCIGASLVERLQCADSGSWPNGRNGRDSRRTRVAREGLWAAHHQPVRGPSGWRFPDRRIDGLADASSRPRHLRPLREDLPAEPAPLPLAQVQGTA